QEAEPIEFLLLHRLLNERIEQQVHDVVGQRSADEKLHRQIVDAFWIFAIVGLVGEDPALREDVADGAGDGLEAVVWARRRRRDNVVKDQVAFEERVGRAVKVDGAAPVLLEERGPVAELFRGGRRCGFRLGHRRFLSKDGFFALTRRVSEGFAARPRSRVGLVQRGIQSGAEVALQNPKRRRQTALQNSKGVEPPPSKTGRFMARPLSPRDRPESVKNSCRARGASSSAPSKEQSRPCSASGKVRTPS